ncbi:MAG TPA: hypothetical protein VNI61_09485 [Gemmatimonadales bacterium]|nr:hypothetical protein [Gemmatimonadales bacterium]
MPSIDGTYQTMIAVRYANHIELITDTLMARVTLRDVGYRGRFEGSYETAFGDSGLVAGMERPESTLVVEVFGAAPKPMAYVMGLRRLFPWCAFPRLGIGPLLGRLRADSLLLEGGGSLPCFYHLYGVPVEIGTKLDFTIVGVR